MKNVNLALSIIHLALYTLTAFTPFIMLSMIVISFEFPNDTPFILTLLLLILLGAALDQLIGRNLINILRENGSNIFLDRVFRLIPILISISAPPAIVFVSVFIGRQEYTGIYIVCLMLLVGFYSSISNIIVAHELIHSRNRIERILGGLLLVFVSFHSFKIEHTRWHHRYVATDDDPSSASKGTNVYSMIVKALVKNYCNAWNLETQRLAKKTRFEKIYKNEMLGWSLIHILVVMFLYWVQPEAALFFIGQSAVAIIILEAVNYVQHYGLRREKFDNGTYAAVSRKHSWDTTFVTHQFFTLNLGRHSHHHTSAMTPYQYLQTEEDSPQLPFPLIIAITASLVPPLWMWIMDPLVDYYSQLSS